MQVRPVFRIRHFSKGREKTLLLLRQAEYAGE